jgi:ribonuclease HI
MLSFISQINQKHSTRKETAMTKIVLIQKVRGSVDSWAYLVDKKLTNLTATNPMIAEQFYDVLEHIKLHEVPAGEEFIVVSPSLISMIEVDIRALFPEVTFIKLGDANLSRAFHDAFAVPSYQKKAHKTTLFIGSDASGGHRGTVCAWAWVTAGAEANYSMGICEFRDINISEFEGMLRAVIENQETKHARIHVYSDSTSAVDLFNRAIKDGETLDVTRGNYLTDLIAEVRKVSMVKNISVGWVRGHRKHRLNQAADCISRHARLSVQGGKSIRQMQSEADAMFEMFRR